MRESHSSFCFFTREEVSIVVKEVKAKKEGIEEYLGMRFTVSRKRGIGAGMSEGWINTERRQRKRWRLSSGLTEKENPLLFFFPPSELFSIGVCACDFFERSV